MADFQRIMSKIHEEHQKAVGGGVLPSLLCLTVIVTGPSEKASKLRIKHLALGEVNYIRDDC